MLNLDALYVEEAGRAVYRSLSGGRPVELSYAPGNYTAYSLLINPVGESTAGLDAAADWMDNPRRASMLSQLHSEREDGWCVVSWLEHGAYLFRLFGDAPNPPAASYVQEKLGGSEGDAVALCALFASVAACAPRPEAAV